MVGDSVVKQTNEPQKSTESKESEHFQGLEHQKHSENVKIKALEEVESLGEDLGDMNIECDDFEDIHYDSVKEDTENNNPLTQIFEILPRAEVQRYIFSRLDVESLIESRLVCKLWSELVSEMVQCSPLLFDVSAEMIQKLAQKGIPANCLTISKLQEFQYPPEKIGFVKVKKLKFIPFRNSRDSAAFGISNNNFCAVLDEFCNISELDLHSASFEHIQRPSVLKTVKLPKLKNLEISAYNGDGPGFDVCGDILDNTFPSLTTATLSFINRDDFFPAFALQFPLFYPEVFEFISRHHETLRTLTLLFTNSIDERELPPALFMVDHDIPDDKFKYLMAEIPKVQLVYLNLHVTYHEGNARHLFVNQLLTSQRSLVELHLVNLSNQNIQVWNSIPEVLERCAEHLEIVIISGCFCPAEAAVQEQFSCACIKYCYKMKEFRMDICGIEIIGIEDLPKQIMKLSLGQMMKLDQIDFIISTLKNLQEWTLPQGQSQYNSVIPRLTVDIFKRVVKMSTLRTLIIRKRSSSWKKIRKLISYTKGIEFSSTVGPASPGCIKIKIDRKDFDSDRI